MTTRTSYEIGRLLGHATLLLLAITLVLATAHRVLCVGTGLFRWWGG
jgi:hypothetical protein